MIVTTTAGPVRGRRAESTTEFLGIPYAAAPVGPRLFEAPAPTPEWDGIRDVLAFGPTAPKRPYSPPLDRLLADPVVAGDECLNLNVWTPEPARGAGLPVLVWIHGGGFEHGSAGIGTYHGGAFARDGVVLVSLNYRLGAAGFGVFPDAPANRGLLDVLAALRWVRDNIAEFGGDPSGVTVAGQSAGAILTAALMASPASAGLMTRAVLQSGPPSVQPHSAATHTVEQIARRLGVPATAAGFANVDIDTLLTAQAEVTRRGNPLAGGAGFGLVIDDSVVPADPMAALAAGAGRDLDLMAGYTTDEYRLWFVPTGMIDKINWLTSRLVLAKRRIPGRVAKVYRKQRADATAGERLGAIATDALMRVPLNKLADDRRGENTFIYEFGWPSPVAGLGACHAMEIGFVFDTLQMPETIALTGEDAPQSLADAMHRAWVSFATTGRPGWPGWEPTRPVMRFDASSSTVTPAPREAERHALASL